MDLKIALRVFDYLFVSFWGLTLVDMTNIIGQDVNILNIDDSIKTFMAVIGAAYFVIQIPHRIKTQRIERKIKEQELEKLKRENDGV